MANVNFNTVAQASSANVNDYLHITTEGGSHKKVLIQKLVDKAKAEALSHSEAQMLDSLTSGCFICYHHSTQSTFYFCNPSQWTTLQNQGEVADGVLVVEGDKHIIVAPTEGKNLMWGSVLGRPLYDYGTEAELFGDFTGKERTAATLANPLYCNDGTDYAPAFCAAYSRTNKNGKGLTAGKWWLPSIGELRFIEANFDKINTCLSLIVGAEPLRNVLYWSSNEGWGDARCLGLTSNSSSQAKNTARNSARPVSSYQN